MADLASIADLEARLGRSLTATETTRATALLKDASAKVRRFCRRSFAAGTNVAIELRPVGSALRLPDKPVANVDQVEQIGTAGTVDRVLGVTEWEFDGIDLIRLWPGWPRDDWPVSSGTYANTYRVTYDYELAAVPDDIVALCCDLVLRVLTAPTVAAGVSSETVGQYSYRMAEASSGTKVQLTADDKRELRDGGWRIQAGTIQLRMS